MEKRGQFSDVMTFVPVLLVVITLMALFLLVSFWAANSREKGNAEAFFGGDSVILYETANINGERKIIAEDMIASFKNNGNYINDEFKAEIKKIMLSDEKFSGKESCVYLSIGEFQDFRKLILYYSANSKNDIYFHKGIDGDIEILDDLGKTKFGIQDEITSSLSEIRTNLNDKEASIISYYGGCTDA